MILVTVRENVCSTYTLPASPFFLDFGLIDTDSADAYFPVAESHVLYKNCQADQNSVFNPQPVSLCPLPSFDGPEVPDVSDTYNKLTHQVV